MTVETAAIRLSSVGINQPSEVSADELSARLPAAAGVNPAKKAQPGMELSQLR